jgi:hypothetical protein
VTAPSKSAETTVEVPSTVTFTVFAGRKNGLPNYSNREAALHGQVSVPTNASLEDVEGKVDAMFTFLESKVAQRLGLTWSVDDSGRVVVLEDLATGNAAKPAQARASAAPKATAARKGGSKPDPAPYWDLLQTEINAGEIVSFWDNRVGKTNPRGPDFKHKTDQFALWLNDAPEGFDAEGLI